MSRILLAIDSLEKGGAQKNIVILANKLLAKNHDVSILTLDNKDNDFYSLNRNLKRFSLDSKIKSKNYFQAIYNNLKRIYKIFIILKKVSPTTIISFINTTNVILIISNFFFKKNIIISERNSFSLQKLPMIWQVLRNITYNYATAITCNSIDSFKDLKTKFQNKKIVYIQNFISSPKILKLKKKKILLAIGRLHKQKRFDKLINDFKRFIQSNTHSGFKLVILGSGPEENNLRKMISPNLSKKIIMPGKVNSQKYYNEASIFILSSDYEGMPNVLLEAMSYSLPIIIYKANSEIRRFLKHEISALILDENKKNNNLANILKNFEINSNKFIKLGKKAKKNFDIIDNERIYEKWNKIIKSK